MNSHRIECSIDWLIDCFCFLVLSMLFFLWFFQLSISTFSGNAWIRIPAVARTISVHHQRSSTELFAVRSFFHMLSINFFAHFLPIKQRDLLSIFTRQECCPTRRLVARPRWTVWRSLKAFLRRTTRWSDRCARQPCAAFAWTRVARYFPRNSVEKSFNSSHWEILSKNWTFCLVLVLWSWQTLRWSWVEVLRCHRHAGGETEGQGDRLSQGEKVWACKIFRKGMESI